MSINLSKLFSSRKSASRKTRRPSLRVDRLDDRLVPTANAVTASVSPTGILNITASGSDGGYAWVKQVSHPVTADTIEVHSGSPYGPVVFSGYQMYVTGINFVGGNGDDFCNISDKVTKPTTLSGGAGNDNLSGGSGIDLIVGGAGNDFMMGWAGNDSLNGGAGNDNIQGGDGNDLFIGSAGQDFYKAGTGYNVLNRMGYRITPNMGSEIDAVVGIINGSFTPEELNAKGQLTVSQVGSILSFNGPSGAGFNITGNWQAKATSWGGTKFIATAPVMLQSALGAIPMGVAGETITVYANPSEFAGVGEYQSADWGALSFNSNTTGPFSTFKHDFGMGLTVNAPGYDIGLDLGSAIEGTNAPLASAVPYFHYKGGITGSVNLAGLSAASPGPDASLSIVFDPADPMLYVGMQDAPGVPELGFAYSAKGQIPFKPDTDLPMSAPIFGNLFLNGKVKLGDYPIAVGGSMVLDLDANGDGKMANFSVAAIKEIATGELDLGTALKDALSDLKLGSNGSVSLLTEKGGFKFDAKLVEGSLVMMPGQIGFKLESNNILAGTPMASVISNATWDISGNYYTDSKTWDVTMHSGTAKFGGYQAWDLKLTMSSAAKAITATTLLTAPGNMGDVYVTGTIGFEGDFSVYGEANWNLDAGLIALKPKAKVSFSKIGSALKFFAGLTATIKGEVKYQGVGVDATGSFTADVTVETNTWNLSDFKFSGSGKIHLDVDTFAGNVPFDANISIDNEGISASMKGLPALSYSWKK